MKVIQQTEHLCYYLNNAGEDMIAIILGYEQLNKVRTYDICTDGAETYYICPELFNVGMCEKCFKQYAPNAEFNISLSQPTFNRLIHLVTQCGITDWSSMELNYIQQFLDNNSNRKINIRKFIETFREGGE